MSPAPGGAAVPATLEEGLVMRARGISLVYLQGTPFETWALDALDLDVREGEMLGIVGATGSGKSTLVQMLCGLLDANSGTVQYGRGIDPQSPSTSVGLVFQQPEDQIFERTVREEIAFGPRQLGLDEAEVTERVYAALEAVGLSPERSLARSPFELSGGEKRRVAIASLLAMRPRVLIFDEPTAGLDSRGRRQLLAHIRRLHDEQGRTILVISHDMEMLSRLAGRLLVMASGRVRCLDTPRIVYSRTDDLAAAGLRPPVWIELLERLRASGLPVRTDLLDVGEALDEIARVMNAPRGR